MPEHLRTTLRAAHAAPKKPPLPDHSKRPLARPDGFLLPYSHPFAADEVAVVKRLERCQAQIKRATDARQAREAMQALAPEAYKMRHLGGDAMAHWTDNLKAELHSRGVKTDEVDVLVQWGKVLPYDAVFAGLGPDANAVVCPVEHHLYILERKRQERATKAAETKRATWEAKHGEAVRAHAARRDEWADLAQKRASAVVAYRQAVLKDLPVEQPSYAFEAIEASHTASVAEAAQSELFGMRQRQAFVDEERQRHATESANVPPFKVQILLRNAWAAGDEFATCVRRALRAREEAMVDLAARREEHRRQRSIVIWEHGRMDALLRDVRAAARASIVQTMGDAYPKDTLRALPAWPEPAWVARVTRRRAACAGVRKALEAHGERLGADEKVHERTIADLRAMLAAHERAFADLPLPEPEPAPDDDAAVVCTCVVTRAERDAKGWAEAEVLDA